MYPKRHSKNLSRLRMSEIQVLVDRHIKTHQEEFDLILNPIRWAQKLGVRPSELIRFVRQRKKHSPITPERTEKRMDSGRRWWL